MVLDVQEVSFEELVLKSDKPVLVQFFAVWSGDCRSIEPVINSISEKFEGRMKVVKIDIDSNPNMAYRFEFNSIPTMLLFKNGEVIDTVKSLVTERVLTERLEALV